MITLETTVTGSQLGLALSGDPEEFSYFLRELSDDGEYVLSEVGGYLSDGESDQVADYLRRLADQIDPPAEPDQGED